MSRISIQRAHNLSQTQARAAVESAVASLAKKYGFQAQWQGDTAHIDGNGVTGTLEVSPQQVSVNLSLGMMVAMLKPIISDSIEEKLSEVFGA